MKNILNTTLPHTGNIRSATSMRGFTIVELLIVIVVIGILAAIVIVAYNGITQRANANAAKANAASIKKAAEAFNAQCPETSVCTVSGYPTYANLSAYSATAKATAKLPAGVTINTAVALTSSNADGKTLLYESKSTTGVCIGYWDATTGGVAWLLAGDAATGGTNANPWTCS